MTKIEWATETWNPITGCTKVSEGCKHCYAERMARRLAGRFGYPEAPNHFDVTLHPDKLELPLRWKKPRTVFVCSMGDLFHEDVPFTFVSEIWLIAAGCPQHTFQILTKRPRRMLQYVTELHRQTRATQPLPNIWLGVSVENQEAADERIPLLLQTPAAVRFVSCEPLLGAAHFRRPDFSDNGHGAGWLAAGNAAGGPKIDWVIVGGESGPGARPMMIDWARDLVLQCKAAGVPVFMKQVGTWAAKFSKYTSRKGADPSEWPVDLRVREYPNDIR